MEGEGERWKRWIRGLWGEDGGQIMRGGGGMVKKNGIDSQPPLFLCVPLYLLYSVITLVLFQFVYASYLMRYLM